MFVEYVENYQKHLYQHEKIGIRNKEPAECLYVQGKSDNKDREHDPVAAVNALPSR